MTRYTDEQVADMAARSIFTWPKAVARELLLARAVVRAARSGSARAISDALAAYDRDT